eukprot:2671482-Rhodomonas_salina.7
MELKGCMGLAHVSLTRSLMSDVPGNRSAALRKIVPRACCMLLQVIWKTRLWDRRVKYRYAPRQQ